MIPNWSRADLTGLKDEMSSINWREQLHGKSAEENWTHFCITVTNFVENLSPWNSDGKNLNLFGLMLRLWGWSARKTDFWKVSSSTKIRTDSSGIKKWRRKQKKATLNCKRRFERNLAQDKNKRAFTSYVRSKTKSRVAVGPLKEDGNMISSDRGMAGI